MKIALATAILLILHAFMCLAAVPEYADIIVDKASNGDYRSITEAIAALPMYAYQRTIIFIRNGVYEEKLRIDQNYVTLRGESRDSTIIRYGQLREDWNKNKDFIGPAVVNIHGDDVVLDNLTIENSQPEIGPHAFAIYGDGTRTIITRCNVLSKGGDTVSLWNYKEGMYYHADCYFEGAVDFVCPRGWCFIRDSKFIEVKETAAIWHAGSYDPQQKLVIRNSYFDGVQGFELGRNHYEAQFYLLDSHFSERMADRPIYLVLREDPEQDNPNYYGEREYFYNCHKEGKEYDWLRNNLEAAPGNPNPAEITPAWTFSGAWNPEDASPLAVIDYSIQGKFVILTFNEIVTVRGQPAFRNRSGKWFRIVKQRFNDINKLTFSSEETIREDDLLGEISLQDGNIISSIASVHERSIGRTFQIITK